MDDMTGRARPPGTGDSADPAGDNSDPQAMLELLTAQQQRTVGATTVDESLLYLAWGIAILVGYVANYMGRVGLWGIGPTLGVVVAVGCGLAAITLTAVHVAQRTRGMSGPANRQGTLWGIAWPALFAGEQLIAVGMARAGASETVLDLYYTGGAGLITGALYLSGGTLWDDPIMYRLGLWILAVFGAGTIIGLPAGLLVMAVLGGGGLLVGAAVAKKRAASRPGPRP